MRAAFDDLTITRGIVLVEGNHVACQTSIAGRFVREFTHSPVGPLPPTGDPVAFDLINIFRHDDDGRLAEEWIQTDHRSVLRQLGAEGADTDPGAAGPRSITVTRLLLSRDWHTIITVLVTLPRRS